MFLIFKLIISILYQIYVILTKKQKQYEQI